MIKFKYIVTSALPYANYQLHLGHLASCLLPGDIFTKFLKLNKEDAVYICGTDDHGTPITVTAQKEGITPQEVVDKYHKKQKEALDKYNIDFDVFSGTSNKDHIKNAQDIYLKIKEKGYFYTKEIEQWYCEKCKKSLPDRFVEGICPYCGAEGARGDQCEECKKLLDALELKEAYCVTCKEKPIVKKAEQVYFKLSGLQEELKDFVNNSKGWSKNAKSFALAWLKEGLRDRCISRDMKWGVAVPDMENRVIYVWFENALGYISFTQEIGKGEWWKEKETKIVHFMGKDNIPFHTILFPAQILVHGGFTLPDKVIASEYLNYKGGKFSKSKGSAFYIDDAIDLFPADYWRYYLTVTYPEHRDVDFTWEDFKEKINNDLNNDLGNFIHRTLTFTQKFFDKKIPKPDEYTEKDKEVLAEISETHEKVTKLLYDVKLKEALKRCINLVRVGNQYLTAEEPWKNKEKTKNVIYICLNISHALSILLEPFIPESANKIKKFLNQPEKQKWSDAKKLLESGKEISNFEPLFEKIDIKSEVKIGGKDFVKFEDFEKMDLRVGKILSAERVEGADKLLKLEVDTGEKRTLVAGIAEYYKPEELIGKEIVVLVNLEPRKIKGIESQGMLLAAEEGDKVVLVSTDKEIKAGAKVE